jgi:hypothetical protein
LLLEVVGESKVEVLGEREVLGGDILMGCKEAPRERGEDERYEPLELDPLITYTYIRGKIFILFRVVTITQTR